MKFLIKQKILFSIFCWLLITGYGLLFVFPTFCLAAEKKIPYQTVLVKQNFSTIEMEANKEIFFEVKFKNTGASTWYNNGKNYLALNTTNPSERQSVFTHSSWPYFYQPAKMQEKIVKPNGIGTFKFTLRAPNIFESKKYIENFRLVANDLTLVEGKGVVTISINVKGAPKPKEILPPQSNVKISLSAKTNLKQTIKIISNEGYKIKDKNNYQFLFQPSGGETEIGFDSATKQYFLNINGEKITSADSYFKLYPKKESEGILEIINYDDFNKSIENANNSFKGILEIKYDSEVKQFWVSNELPDLKEAAIFNPNELISDADFINYNSMTVEEIQTFLSSKGSFLANFSENNRSAGQIIWDASHGYGDASGSINGIVINSSTGTVSPKVILTTLQKEQSLISRTSDPEVSITNKAMGYACPDSKPCNPTYSGFTKQVENGAWQLRYNYERASGKNFSDYQVGQSAIFLNENNSYNVAFNNRATAALYRYTPHIYNGNYNFWKNHQAWFTNQPYKLAYKF